MVFILIFSVVELNAFFLKYLLWIPPPHPINVSYSPRFPAFELLWSFVYCTIAYLECYGIARPSRVLPIRYWPNKQEIRNNGLGILVSIVNTCIHLWCGKLCCAVAGVETLIEFKFGRGQFPTPAPPSVYIPWGIFIVLFLGTATIYFTTRGKPDAAALKKKK